MPNATRHIVKHWPAAALYGALTILVLAPAAAGLLPALSADALRTVLAESRQWTLLKNSLLLACGAALLATLLGAPAGYLLARHRLPARPVLIGLLALPLLIPGYVMTIAWIELLGNNGWLLPGVFPIYALPVAVLVLGFTHFPVDSFLVHSGPVAGVNASASASVRLTGNPLPLSLGGTAIWRCRSRNAASSSVLTVCFSSEATHDSACSINPNCASN